MQVVLAAGTYVHRGVFNVSVTNILIIVAMIVVFVLALVIPFPHHHDTSVNDDESPS